MFYSLNFFPSSLPFFFFDSASGEASLLYINSLDTSTFICLSILKITILILGLVSSTSVPLWFRCAFGIVFINLVFPHGGSAVKNLPVKQETPAKQVQFLGREDPLVKEITTHTSILPGKSHGRGDQWATIHGVAKVRHNLEIKQQQQTITTT